MESGATINITHVHLWPCVTYYNQQCIIKYEPVTFQPVLLLFVFSWFDYFLSHFSWHSCMYLTNTCSTSRMCYNANFWVEYSWFEFRVSLLSWFLLSRLKSPVCTSLDGQQVPFLRALGWSELQTVHWCILTSIHILIVIIVSTFLVFFRYGNPW